eukprot:CAMPEP_0184310212 /NCGR_PEP_ID=MMETSP1049-20130417/26464_1 /TAXON_ID=77928 /ORGANISM="Proteomonas sulcata, Strain CCMP704" /LENGTH=39 /DNA_ID= /DNA_START= /DNA_END= /DNA_ORIENTATION=
MVQTPGYGAPGGDEMGNGGMFDGDGVGSNTPDEDNYPYN